jgi:hypothetical protein
VRFSLIIALIASIFIASPVKPAFADDQAYFRITSEKDKSLVLDVTDSLIARVGAITYKAMLPGMEGGPHEVRGPLVRDLLQAGGFTGATLHGAAYDKYEMDIPVADFTAFDVIAAVEVDGRPISIRERGPAWIVYPNVEHPELQNDPIYESRSIWQVRELTIK